MTKDDFRGLLKTMLGKLPSFEAWFKKMPMDDRRSTLAHWYEDVFSDLVVDDCDEVVTRIMRGETDKPFWGELPAFLAGHCRELAYQRRVEEDRSSKKYGGIWSAVVDGPSMREAFRNAIDARKQAKLDGDDEDAVARMTIARAFKDLPVDKRDAKVCRKCNDSGFVTCWHTRVLAAALKLPIAERHDSQLKWYTVSVVCSCKAGVQRWPVKKSGKVEFEDMPTVDDQMQSKEDGAIYPFIPVNEGKEAVWLFADRYEPPNANDFGEYGKVVMAGSEEF